MKNKAVVIGIIVAILVAGAGMFYVMTKDKDDTKTANNSTSTTTTDSPEEKKDVRQAVWEQLSPELQGQTDWKQGTLSKIVYKEGMGTVEDSSYVGKEVYVVDFPTDRKAVPNNVVIYADTTTYRQIGSGFVD